MGIPSLDQTIEVIVPDDGEELFLALSLGAGFVLLLHEGAGLGWSLVFAPVVALPIALLLMLGYLLLVVPMVLLIVFVLQVLAAMRAMLRRPSPKTRPTPSRYGGRS